MHQLRFAKMVDPFNLLNPNATLQAASPLLTGGWFTSKRWFFDQTATFRGAFGTSDWTTGWARFDAPTSVKESGSEIPVKFELSQNYPNPFNPSTKISFSVAEPGNVKLSVYNVLGQQVAELVNGYMSAGSFVADFDASSLSSGMYIYTLESGAVKITRKMSLLK
ncbi:MAG: T9SS type A sorting domain-containing protein [Ignavibacteriales bacterium]|nr:T9SS type A sorting domain-containing protein [Ignavibacteriales bacterium]